MNQFGYGHILSSHFICKQISRPNININCMDSQKPIVYFGQMTCPVSLQLVKSSILVESQQIVPDLTSQGMFNALKYRHELKYLGQQYKEVTMPCIPGHQHTTKSADSKQKYETYIKTAADKSDTLGMASGKRSAILVREGSALRYKGCGNEVKGFNQENNESRGHHFWHTAKRELYMTHLMNTIFKEQLKIWPPANIPLYLFNYTNEEIQRMGLANDLSKIGKYCCVFETQGDRRAGTHLISPLQVVYLLFSNYSTADWNQIFKQKQRIDNGELVQFVTNWELLMEEGFEFIQIYDRSSPIQNYITLDHNPNLTIDLKEEILISLVQKLVTEQFKAHTLELMRNLKDLRKTIPIILGKIGWEMGRIKRVMCEKRISWGFFSDHGVQWHCNAHLNNFIVTPPSQNSHFLLPLDYDLAFTEEQFINIELDSPKYGTNDKDAFQNYLCAEFNTMQMSLFGLEFMNFKYGILEQQQNNDIDRKMGRIAFRDTLVHSFNQGMRNNQQFQKQLSQKWNENIVEIGKLVEACLYLSDKFQT